MNNTINIYQTLNEREKYILEKLEINECDLKPEYASSVITVMKRMTTSISKVFFVSSESDLYTFNFISG